MAYTGDVPANTVISSYESFLRNWNDDSFIARSVGTKTFTTVMHNPTASASQIMAYIRLPFSVTYISGVIAGGTNVILNVEDRSSLGTSGTDILGTDIVMDKDGQGAGISPPGYAVSAGHWLVLAITSVSGSPSEVLVMVTGELT